MMLRLTLLEHTTAKLLLEIPSPTAIGPPAKIAFAAVRHASSLFTFFISGSTATGVSADEDESLPSSETSEKGCIGGGGGRGTSAFVPVLLVLATSIDSFFVGIIKVGRVFVLDVGLLAVFLDLSNGWEAGSAGAPPLLLCARALFISVWLALSL